MKSEARSSYRANFLWPPAKGSVEEAGYEFANGRTEGYRKLWWKILQERMQKRDPVCFPMIRGKKHPYHCPICGTQLVDVGLGILRCRRCLTEFVPARKVEHQERSLTWSEPKKKPGRKNKCQTCGYPIAPGNTHCGECVCEEDGL